MKIVIELTEEDAAILANHWKRQPITETVQLMAERDAEHPSPASGWIQTSPPSAPRT